MLQTEPLYKPFNQTLLDSLAWELASGLSVDGGQSRPDTYDKQHAFITNTAHHSAFVAGIGSGKTIGGALRSLYAANGIIGDPDGEYITLQTPNLGVVTAPTYPMLRDATIRAFMEFAGDAVTDYNKTEKMATLTNGSQILFRSTDNPDTLRGPSISWWWGDEAAMYTPDVWKIMIGRMRQFGKYGYAWITTTPRGRNWVWQRFIRDANENYWIIKARSRDNIFAEEQVFEAWEADYVGDFALQELEGEFVAFEGLIYPEFDRTLHVFNQLPPNITHFEAGVDWGYSHPGVIIVGGVDNDGRIWRVHEEYHRHKLVIAYDQKPEFWVETAIELRRLWNIRTFHCDPSEPDYIKAFNYAGLNAVNANNTVSTGIQAVKARLIRQGDGKPRSFYNANMVNTIDEFESYQWAENRHGVKDEPLKVKDHAMDADRYLVMGIDRARRSYQATTVSTR